MNAQGVERMSGGSQYIDEAVWTAVYDAGYPGAEEVTYQNLSLDSETLHHERHTFLDSGGEAAASFRPNHVNLSELRDHSEHLAAVHRDLPRLLAGHPRLVDAWGRRLAEEQVHLKMVEASVTSQPAVYAAGNNYTYGTPDKTTFAAVASWYCTRAESALDSDKRADVQRAALGVLAALGSVARQADYGILTPDRKTFTEVREQQLEAAVGFAAILFDGIELPANTEEVTAIDGDPLIRRMFKNIGSEKGIKASDYWSMSAANNALMRPDAYRMPGYDFKEFLIHEMAHDDERIQAGRGLIKLATSGFDHYEIGNEGRAVVLEQTVNERIEDFTARSRWNELLGRHLASSLAAGHARNDPSARVVYKILRDISRLFEYGTPENIDNADLSEATEKADRAAWELLYGSYKGTDGSGDYGGYGRPAIYLQGSINSWKHASLIPFGRRGKIDIANPRHVETLALTNGRGHR